ncbi:MAG: hypothetical protein AAF492_16100, partial [Verrucomicrobiota bacterium]
NPKRKGVRTNRYLYEVDLAGGTRLFDHQADPFQRKNLPLDAVDENDLKLLKRELGHRLVVAEDGWAKTKKHGHLITYS